jgi:uncharacterized membrane protein
MIAPVFLWWLWSTLLGVAVLPVIRRVFSRLPGRGLPFARPVGLLLGGYLFWLGSTFGVINSDLGGALLAVAIMAGVAWWFERNKLQELITTIRDLKPVLIISEILFLLAFLGWAFVRANNPEITGTEKPMELAFLNSILQSPQFPPRDPWLSGYAISYYYFGYVLLAFIARLSGVASGVAFNLGNSLWFAMVAVGTYTLLYDLLSHRFKRPVLWAPLLGPVFVLLSGNLAGILEVLWSKHIFWRAGADGLLHSNFWSWIGLEDLENPPIQAASWLPSRYLWWWRGSRVIRDLNLLGVPIGLQSIDEFPFFSFLLADNHPHVLAMPFVLVTIGFVFQVFLGPRDMADRFPANTLPPERIRQLSIIAAAGLLFVILLRSIGAAGEVSGATGTVIYVLKGFLLYGLVLIALGAILGVFGRLLPLPIERSEILVGALLYGSLAFLNTWDLPIYFSLFLLVLIWKERELSSRSLFRSSGPTAIAMLAIGIALFLPWYPTFSSQAGGILPHLLHPTRLVHFLIMFAPALIPILGWLIYQLVRQRNLQWHDLRDGLFVAFGLPLGLLVLSWMLAGVLYFTQDFSTLQEVFNTLAVRDLSEAFALTLHLRLTDSWVAILLGGILGVVFILGRNFFRRDNQIGSTPFVLILVAIGALLILGPEFLYLKDQFGLRMNTIFKFYFASWILWGLAGAYASAVFLHQSGIRWTIASILILIPLALGLVYSPLALWTKTNGFQPPSGRTLDGALHPAYAQASDREAIDWMVANLLPDIVAEAVGGSYTYYGRVSVHSGFPTVLGWPGHEGQWRGGYEEQGSRDNDIRLLYQTTDWNVAREILDRYNIRYVYVGELERITYSPLFEGKFEAFMDLIHANDTVRIYVRRGEGPG